ncbi:Replication factor C, subunit RFC4 [Coemansia asiatica]|uniref:Replication factor C, subunit RFC4 n=1 Tax=Coemansia asiatica TaxID=1052880 RepID=A0A9W7XIH1_9FUNG|nr:Replication factor C, subunit RFC4 [Coemansia asiatica]KAJ2887843.1 Replication factor C, subunit RFC4 [Coemansia asiatica]
MSSRYAKQQAENEVLNKAIVNDSLFALGATFVGAGILSAAAYRFSPRYRRIPISAKTALILGPSIGAFYIRGEHVGTEYRRNKYLNMLGPEERAEALRRQEAIATRSSLVERSMDYVTEHRWSILGYTWLAGISGSLYHLYRQKGMTVTQKAVQARMYAQLITIIGILSTAAIASLSNKGDKKHVPHNSAALEAALAGDMKTDELYSNHPRVAAHDIVDKEHAEAVQAHSPAEKKTN